MMITTMTKSVIILSNEYLPKGSYVPQLQAFIYTNTYNFSQALEETNTVLFIIPFFLDMEAENKEVKS